jgi:hypothetical protein
MMLDKWIIFVVNDNTPHFHLSNYMTSISEDIPVGTSFIQVSADDDDTGSNAIIDFYFDEKSSDVQTDAFKIDRTSGTVRINHPVDRETQAFYQLPILAIDRGTPPLIGRATLFINLV